MRGALTALTFAACVVAPAAAHAQDATPLDTAAAAPAAENTDPWEGLNRNMFAVHEAVDQAVLEPVARGYRAITPRPVRSGVRNFLRNLRGPVIFANDMLQGEFGRAGVTAARFGINTTIGIAGVFDPATNMGFDRHDEDFGQTLAVWGVDSGPYLFVPIFGPSSVRDTFGRVVDIAFDPLTWLDGDDAGDIRLGRAVLDGIAVRETLLEAVDDVRRDALDPYVTFRSSYELLRASAIQNGREDVQDLPDFDDIPAMPEEDAIAPAQVEENPQHSSGIQKSHPNVFLAFLGAPPTSEPMLKHGELK